MQFETWVEAYIENIFEELGEYRGQEHLDMLSHDDLLDIMDNQSPLDREITEMYVH